MEPRQPSIQKAEPIATYHAILRKYPKLTREMYTHYRALGMCVHGQC